MRTRTVRWVIVLLLALAAFLLVYELRERRESEACLQGARGALLHMEKRLEEAGIERGSQSQQGHVARHVARATNCEPQVKLQ